MQVALIKQIIFVCEQMEADTPTFQSVSQSVSQRVREGEIQTDDSERGALAAFGSRAGEELFVSFHIVGFQYFDSTRFTCSTFNFC